jgi:hypothetical protein
LKHLLVDITAHGYGHIAQTAPVVDALARRMEGLRVTVRSAAATDYLRQRFNCDFRHEQVALDFGMHMRDAVRVDVPRSLAAYRDYHADWSGKVAAAAETMRALHPDLLLANVPYLSLAAAQAAGIPAVAMCCLNWADIYRHYAPDDAASGAIHAQMRAAYDSAQTFLRVMPAMPMPDLRNTREIACIAQSATDDRARLRAACGAVQGERVVLVAMGGFDYRPPAANWPSIPGVRWVLPQAWGMRREDMVALEATGMLFRDVLASCDAVLTKPGYGTFAEAACHGVPVLYVPRGDWPEVPFLADWLRRNGVGLEVAEEVLGSGGMEAALQKLWAQPLPPLPSARGADEAAEHLCKLLTLG